MHLYLAMAVTAGCTASDFGFSEISNLPTGTSLARIEGWLIALAHKHLPSSKNLSTLIYEADEGGEPLSCFSTPLNASPL